MYLTDQLRKLFANEVFDRYLSNSLKSNPNSLLLRKLVPSNDLYAKDSFRNANLNGFNFRLDLSDYPEWSLYFSNPVDSSANILQFVEENYFVLDIGGNIGQTALLLSQKVGKSGKVISFEPFPSTNKRFEENLARNKEVTNIKLEKFGLGNKNETLVMHNSCNGNSAANRILSSDSTSVGQTIEVNVRILDEYIKDAPQIVKIDFIKIDVEGFEMQVLEGAKETLERFHPKLFIEINDKSLKNQGSSSKELLNFLKQRNYEIIDVSTNKSISSENDLVSHTDIYCFNKN